MEGDCNPGTHSNFDAYSKYDVRQLLYLMDNSWSQKHGVREKDVNDGTHK